MNLKRRIIVNNDFYNIFQVAPPVTDADVHAAVDKLAGTQVDTLALMTDSLGGGTGGISPELVDLYRHPEADPCVRNLADFYKAGKDPFGMVLTRARKQGLEFLASIRMNDTHYKDHLYHPWVDPFYYDHLHLRVGAGGSRGGAEFDYRMSAVRDRLLNQVRRTITTYDVDGVELDMTRNCLFFPRGTDAAGHTAECAPVMTDLIRQVRALLDERGKKRRRPLVLSVVVPYSLFRCRQEALDIPVWARLGYVDMLCLSTPFLADFDRDIRDTKLKVPGVPVYAGCDRNVAFGAGGGRVVPMQTYRAMAANYLRQGADGTYLYNVMSWTMNQDRPMPEAIKRDGGQGETDGAPRDYDRNLLNEVGALDTLECLDKLYLVSHGAESPDRPYGSLPVTVPAGGEVTLRMGVGDDVMAAEKAGRLMGIFLQTISSDCMDYNNYTLLLNGVDLSRQYAFIPFAAKPDSVLLFPEPARKGALPAPEQVRRHPVRPIDLHVGVNYITIRSYRDPLTIRDVELAIQYHHTKAKE
jgi:hypothetical protein